MSGVPIFQAVIASAQVLALLGSNPTRFYPFGVADENTPMPYAVWQVVGGSPENYLGDRPRVDNYSVQVDVYGKTAQSCRPVVDALRDALEAVAYITAWNGESRDFETKNYRIGFTVEFITPR